MCNQGQGSDRRVAFRARRKRPFLQHLYGFRFLAYKNQSDTRSRARRPPHDRFLCCCPKIRRGCYFSVVLIESGFGYGYGLLGNKRSEY